MSKGKIINSLERKLRVQRKEAKEDSAKDAAIIKEAMAELSNSLEKYKELLLSERM
jgi:hypothetical protein